MLFHGVSFSSNTHISVFSACSCILSQLRVTYCFSLAVFPAVMVIISLSIAAGKDGIKSFVDDEQLMRNLYRYKKNPEIPLPFSLQLWFFIRHFHFFNSCWMSSANNLIWIFVAFVIIVEVVSKTIFDKECSLLQSMDYNLSSLFFYWALFTMGCHSASLCPSVCLCSSFYLSVSHQFVRCQSLRCFHFKLNILILVRVIREMTKMQQKRGTIQHVRWATLLTKNNLCR